ncbi:Xpo1-domain-containing protein [Daldinia loculata]|uniref:Xpo1-domain-containing protein n=1 Tax=Daldinia loculata TaxID=103429 RepID=UPI0020C28CC9|nr:Xpo1-domain-containing protein [Daldinia loculata]KAI1643831.1 Xpo1-domain-containing protein [Daldinia loculata]KAI2778703.1 Xpo1-domain-containing protein [Daldinia loculata]
MESQIENAIEIAWNPNSDQALKTQAFDYLHQLRADPHAWQVCIGLFARTPRSSDVVRLVSLEIVNNAIHVQSLDTQALLSLRDALLAYVQSTYGTNQSQIDSPTLQNKLTQTLTLLFVSLYKQGWESFLDDVLALTILPGSNQRDNVPGVILYLRILSSIHDEIADVLLVRQDVQARSHTELKDLMRARDVGKVAQSWQDLLAQYGNQDDAIIEMTLKVIGKWASWIDISLIINDGMLSLILPLVGRSNNSGSEDKVRDAAVEAFTEIVGKKMRPADKAEMISFLNLRDIISQIIASPPLNEFKGTPRYDTDLGEAVAKLVNTVVADIVRVLEDRSTDDSTRAKSNQLLHEFIPFLLRFFSDEYDEVCSTVIPSLTDVLAYFRKLSELPPSFSETLPPILNAIIMKMRYDETSSWGNEDEQTDEAEFLELRKRLQVLQKTVAAVDQNLYVEVLSNLVANTFQTLDERGSQMDWRDVDLALHEMSLFGELAMPNQGLGPKSQPSPVASERLMAMMTKMVQSGIANFPHPAILLNYMEICVRYCAFFETQPALIGQVLENFVRLVHQDHVRIRTRSWYLFHRFVKHLRAQVGNVAETVIQSISDLLPIQAEVPGEDADDDMSSDQTDNSASAVFNSQLYLFEAIGCISSTSATPVEKQALYARSVMDPLFSDMEQHLPRARNSDAQAILQIHHIILALGTLAHGFSDWTPGANSSNQRPPPAKALSDEFARAAEGILIALSELNTSSEIRTACRSAFSRLLGVLGSAVLPQLPQWIDGLLSRSSSKDEMAMFLRLLDQVVYGFKSEIYEVLNQLLTPLLQRVFGGLSEPINGTDDEIQLAELRREYLTFIGVILNNDLAGVLVSEANQGFFESLITSILTLARDIGPGSGSLPASRLSLGLLAKMAGAWGGPDVANISANPSAPTGSPSPAIPGFDQFLIDRFHSVCWEVLRDPQFNPAGDAQAKLVLHEIAGLEQAVYLKTGGTFLEHLQSTLFPGLGIDGNDFLRAMTTSTDKKAFSKYLQGLMKESR